MRFIMRIAHNDYCTEPFHDESILASINFRQLQTSNPI